MEVFILMGVFVCGAAVGMRIGAVPRRPNRRGALILLEKEMRAAFAVGRGHATVRGILAILHQLREDATNAITDPKLQDREVDLLRGKIDAMDEVEAAVEAELAASEEK